jgi:hypothetical protein
VPVVMGIAHLLRVLQVPPYSPTVRVVVVMMVGPSSSGSGGVKPPFKKAHTWSFFLVSSLYVHGVVH